MYLRTVYLQKVLYLKLKEWLNQKGSLGLPDSKYAFVTNQSEFDAVDPTEADYLFGKTLPFFVVFDKMVQH